MTRAEALSAAVVANSVSDLSAPIGLLEAAGERRGTLRVVGRCQRFVSTGRDVPASWLRWITPEGQA